MDFRNNETGESGPGHLIGTDESGRKLYHNPTGWTPVGDYELDEDGRVVAIAGSASLQEASTATVRDLTSGDVHRLPGTARCVIAPADLDDATGGAAQVSEADGMVRLSYTTIGGGRETLEAVAGPLVGCGCGPVRVGFPLRRRELRPGDRVLVESTDLDDAGRPMWWLSEVM